jgi:regulator of replication initiation timing
MSESFEFSVGGDSKRIRELEEQLHKTQEENESLRKLSDKLRTRSTKSTSKN